MMSWTEHGGPPVSAPKRRGFGSTVVDAMAKLSVGGEVQLDYDPSGLKWRLMCPAANAAEPLGNESNVSRAAFARNAAATRKQVRWHEREC
jgi:hypothetical protein